MKQLEQTLFAFINGFSHTSSMLDALGIFLASYFQYALGIILIFWCWHEKKKRLGKTVILAEAIIAGLFSRYIIKGLILLFIQRPRPFVDAPSIEALIRSLPNEDLASFPSGHALFLFAFATTLAFYSPRLGKWFFLAALIIGIARVFVGVHWPSDILAGALIGVAGAAFIHWLAKSFHFRTTSNQSASHRPI